MFGADRVDFDLGRSVAGLGASLVWGLTALASPAQAQAPLELRLADVGRFAAFVDMDGIAWTGRTARLRVLQVAEDGFTAGTEAFWGGWRYEVLDCDTRTLAHAGFSSVRVGGQGGAGQQATCGRPPRFRRAARMRRWPRWSATDGGPMQAFRSRPASKRRCGSAGR
jgi:hypothetical protein